MADQINVTERERTSSPWPWIIGLIVLAILIWAVMQMGNGAGDTNDVQIDVPAVIAPAGGTGGDAGAGNDTGGGEATNPQ
jgi:hypothetical protein